ncbi:hypothetical protein [Geomonas oryzae]|uniref:hypothetical protein n=1 Tax=Geomonas oryzae TaxID=2364273 RepID=UPI00100A6A69|nr:hypothetical protein [Geomonas oryzae]
MKAKPLRRSPASPLVDKMDLTRKVLIISTALGILFVAFALRMWVLGGRQNPLKKELMSSFIAVLIFAVIAAIMIYINN